MWQKIMNPCDIVGFFAMDMLVWLLSNFSSKVKTKEGWCLYVLFGVIVWFLWKYRIVTF